MIRTPDMVVQELAELRTQADRGIDILAEAEAELVRLQLAAEKTEAQAFLDAQGTVADRQAVAKLLSAEAREAAELAKVKVNRVKTKMRHLSESMTAVQTSARMVELTYRTAGIGER